ncbi:MAG: ribokinase [Alphaproteobacteria bacterium]
MGKVIVVGSINVDLVVTADRFPRPGETLIGNSFARHPGGKGANQAVAAARMGARTVMIGAVGADQSGEFMRDALSRAGVGTELVRVVSGTPTGTAVITVVGPENSIVVVAGANAALVVEHGSLSIDPGDVVVAQLEVPSAAWTAAFEAARVVGATTILNAAPADAGIAEFLSLCDVVVVNEVELGSLSGQSLPDAADPASLQAAMRAVRQTPDQIIIATRGKAGFICLGRDGVIEGGGHDVPVVDSTGAGDCFVGAFAACLAIDRDLERALTMANAAAAISVQRSGAGNSMPTRAEVIAQLCRTGPDPLCETFTRGGPRQRTL